MQDAQITKEVQRRYKLLSPEMDERMRRQWAAVEAQTLGWGGITTVSHATGLTYPTIAAGLAELDLPAEERRAEACRIRRPGRGRHSLTIKPR